MYQERKQRGRETRQEGALGPTLRSSHGVIIRARWGVGRSPEGTRGRELRRQEWGGFISFKEVGGRSDGSWSLWSI